MIPASSWHDLVVGMILLVALGCLAAGAVIGVGLGLALRRWWPVYCIPLWAFALATLGFLIDAIGMF